MRKNTVANVVKQVSKLVIPVVGVVLSNITVSELLNAFRYCGDVDYNDAVKAIMNSDMISSYKTEAISVLKRDETSEYYKAVISTINSDMISSYKVNVIRSMSNEE